MRNLITYFILLCGFILYSPNKTFGSSPVAVNDTVLNTEDFQALIAVLGNDIQGTSTFNTSSLTILTQPVMGTVIVDPISGELTYTPFPNQNGMDSIEYQVCDNNSTPFCVSAWVIITNFAANDPPVANPDSAFAAGTLPITLNVIANDTDIDSNIDPTSVRITNQPDSGTATVSLTSGIITYRANPGFYGTDTLYYKVGDINTPAGLDTGRVVITVVNPFSSTNITCYEDADGEIDTTFVLAGTSYTYEKIYNHGQNQSVITDFPIQGLWPDTFTMVITDGQGNTDSTIVIITQPGSFGIYCSWIGNLCLGSPANVVINSYGGNPPYFYNFNQAIDSTINDTNFYITPNPDDLYVVSAYDSKGCSYSDTLTSDHASMYVETQGYISGYVNLDGAYPPMNDFDTIKVVLIKKVSTDSTQWIYTDTFNISAPYSPHFYFDSIVPGTYILLVKYDTILPGRNVIPTYSGDVYRWDTAATFEFTSGCSLQYSDINLLHPEVDSGGGSLSGFIFLYDFISGKVETNNDPIPLIDVVIEKDSVQGANVYTPYTATNADSVPLFNHLYHYSATDLPQGSYRIRVFIAGIPQTGFYYPTLTPANDSIINLNFCADSFNVGVIDVCNFYIDSTNFTVDTTTVIVGQKEYPSAQKLSIFPNPSTGDFNIELPKDWEGSTTVKVYSTLGKLVSEMKLDRKQTQLSLDKTLAPGAYLLDVSNVTKRYRQMLMKE